MPNKCRWRWGYFSVIAPQGLFTLLCNNLLPPVISIREGKQRESRFGRSGRTTEQPTRRNDCLKGRGRAAEQKQGGEGEQSCFRSLMFDGKLSNGLFNYKRKDKIKLKHFVLFVREYFNYRTCLRQNFLGNIKPVAWRELLLGASLKWPFRKLHFLLSHYEDSDSLGSLSQSAWRPNHPVMYCSSHSPSLRVVMCSRGGAVRVSKASPACSGVNEAQRTVGRFGSCTSQTRIPLKITGEKPYWPVIMLRSHTYLLWQHLLLAGNFPRLVLFFINFCHKTPFCPFTALPTWLFGALLNDQLVAL